MCVRKERTFFVFSHFATVSFIISEISSGWTFASVAALLRFIAPHFVHLWVMI